MDEARGPQAPPPPGGVPVDSLPRVEDLRGAPRRSSSSRALDRAADLLAASLCEATEADLLEIPLLDRLKLTAKLETAVQGRRQADAVERMSARDEAELDERIAARLRRLGTLAG